MSEISLKEYFAKLNSLLSTNSADEVIHHCRHILQYFPKNVTAYRFLGRALVLNGRWEEGREALRRVLSVIPDDYTAHLGLSEANERMNQSDEAIWHLERALEQRPNDKDLIDALRSLYRQYRHVDNLKVQLTSAAVARQYLRSGAYTQAIDSLRNALSRMSERLDLKLLLAQILWQNKSEEEAAEIALEVLKVLPDCLEANKIMAQLWLGVDRPSDAQRYVNHLEAVDPYLAVELVQGSAPDDDVFQIEELDYSRSAQSELTSARPDWLQEISISSAPAEPAASEKAAPKEKDDEWSNWASAMLGNKSNAEPEKPAAALPTSARFAALRGDEQPPVSTGGLTDLFGKTDDANSAELSALFEAGEAEEQDPMAWLRDTGIEISEEDEQPSFDNPFGDDDQLPQAEDPMAWLQGSNDDLFSDTNSSAAPASGEEDSIAWLQASSEGEFADAQPEAVANSDDSFGWLSDDHLLDEALGLESLTGDGSESDSRRDQAAFARDEQEESAQPAAPQGIPGARRGLTAMLQDTSFDWANQQDEPLVDDAEMDDWLNQFGPAEPNKAKSVTDTPDWLSSLDEPAAQPTSDNDEWFAPETEAPGEFEVDAAGAADTSSGSDDENGDWLAEFAPETTPDWSGAAAEPEPEAEESTVLDWLSQLEPDQGSKQPDASNNAEFVWMSNEDSELGSDAESEEASEGDTPDWLAALEPDQDAEPEAEAESASADSEFSWMSDEALTGAEAPIEAEAVTDDTPDWLAALAPEQGDQDAEPEAAAELSSDSEFSWMTDDALTGAEASVEAEAVTDDTPDWLAALAPELGDQDAEPEAAESASADSEFSWLTEDALTGAEASVEAEAVTDDTPDWLAALAPEQGNQEVEPEAVAEPSSDSEFSWMTEDALTGAEASVEADLVTDDTPDWLAALAPEQGNQEVEPEAVAEPSSDSEFSWMTEDALTGAEASVEAEAVTDDTPDWLAALAPEQGEPEAEPEAVAESTGSDDEFAWLTEDALSQAETEADSQPVAEETPDWLSELEPVQAETEAEPEAVTDPEYTWMSAEAPPEAETPVEMEAVAEEVPDWLSELEPMQVEAEAEPEAEVEAEPAAALEETPDWLSELEPEAEAQAEPEAAADLVTDPEFTWMTEDALSQAETEAESEPEAAEASGDWLAEFEPAEGEPAAVAEEVPDWLSELEPEQSEPEPIPAPDQTLVDQEFGWAHEADLASEVDAESEPVAEEQTPEPVAEPESEPDEVEAPEPVAEAVVAEAAGSAFDDLSDIGDNEGESNETYEEALEPTPAQNAPDWLNAMVPGLDVDYEPSQEEFEPEEEEVEEPAADKREFAWVAEMVEEELAAGERPAAYVFSKVPAWLAPTNSHAGNGKVDDDLPDWPSDDADADVPEWLR